MSIPPRSRGAVEAHSDAFITRVVLRPAQLYFHTEAIGAIALLLASIAALVWVNSTWSDSYPDLWETVLTVDLGLFSVSEPLERWVNDGLLAIFFFVVGLEIKRELVHGELSSPKKAALPVFAAVGGMAVPALIYFAINGTGDGARGWGIPMATDIAFALGVLGLLGRGLPPELRIFLLGVAVVDDLGVILVIAVFYSAGIDWGNLGIAAALIAAIVVANRIGVRSFLVYVVLGTLVWVAVLKSGVHATIAGVVLGALTPSAPYFSRSRFQQMNERLMGDYRTAIAEHDEEKEEAVLGHMEELIAGTESPLERLERLVHPWTAFVILPIFALANAGIELSRDVIGDATTSAVTIGVVLGLIAGKTFGIFAMAWLAVRLGLAALPSGVTWRHIFGVGLVAGIGFTVAIFVSGLAFEEAELVDQAKIGILAASVAAGAGGYFYLRLLAKPPAEDG